MDSRDLPAQIFSISSPFSMIKPPNAMLHPRPCSTQASISHLTVVPTIIKSLAILRRSVTIICNITSTCFNKLATEQIADFQKNFYSIIGSVSRSNKSVLIADKERSLVRIIPVFSSGKGSWLGCMSDSGKIVGDVISPAEDSDPWEVSSE